MHALVHTFLPGTYGSGNSIRHVFGNFFRWMPILIALDENRYLVRSAAPPVN